MIDNKFVAECLAQIRSDKGISARDLSLCIGQSTSYINNIENMKSNISMPMFLNVCEYLGVHPRDFFDGSTQYPIHLSQLTDSLKLLNKHQLSSIENVVKEIIN